MGRSPLSCHQNWFEVIETLHLCQLYAATVHLPVNAESTLQSMLSLRCSLRYRNSGAHPPNLTLIRVESEWSSHCHPWSLGRAQPPMAPAVLGSPCHLCPLPGRRERSHTHGKPCCLVPLWDVSPSQMSFFVAGASFGINYNRSPNLQERHVKSKVRR